MILSIKKQLNAFHYDGYAQKNVLTRSLISISVSSLTLYLNMKDKQFVRLRGSFSNSVAQAYLFLFQGTLLTFANFNKFLQTEEALIHCWHDEMQKIRNNLAIKSRKSEVFQKVKENKLLLSKLGANLQNQKRRELKCRNSHAKSARQVLHLGCIILLLRFCTCVLQNRIRIFWKMVASLWTNVCKQ